MADSPQRAYSIQAVFCVEENTFDVLNCYQQVDQNMNIYKNTLKFHFTSFLDKFFLIKEGSPYNLRRQVIWYYILHGSFQI